MLATLPIQTTGFCTGYVEDIQQLSELWQLDANAYGDGNIEFETLNRWWQTYDSGLPIVSYRGEIIAAFGLWGISEKQTRLFLDGKLKEQELNPLPFGEKTPYWYWSGIVIRPDFRTSLLSPLRLLLRCGVSSWLGTGNVSYKPKAYVYALGMSDQGISLLEGFDFEEIRSSDDMPDQFPLFVREFQDYAEGQTILQTRLR